MYLRVINFGKIVALSSDIFAPGKKNVVFIELEAV
jgi:hypothetical protein